MQYRMDWTGPSRAVGATRWCVEKIDEPSPEKFKLKDPELDGVPSPYAPKPTKKQRADPKLSLGLASPTPYTLAPLAAFCSASHTDEGSRAASAQQAGGIRALTPTRLCAAMFAAADGHVCHRAPIHAQRVRRPPHIHARMASPCCPAEQPTAGRACVQAC